MFNYYDYASAIQTPAYLVNILENIPVNSCTAYKKDFNEESIVENELDFVIELVVPGMSKEDFKISVSDKVLTVETTKAKTEKKYNKSFTKKWTLCGSVDTNKITAKYIDGILYITIVKSEEVKPKIVTVE